MKKQKNNLQSERKREILGIVFGSAVVLVALSFGLYFVPKAYASQSISNYKGAQVMEYMNIALFCAFLIVVGMVIISLSIKNIMNLKQ